MKKKVVLTDEYAIVTGASKGLGFYYCEEFLKKGINVIGVARNCDSLDALAKKYPNLVVEKMNLDLSVLSNCEILNEKTKDKNVSYLFNNAGYGVWGFFDENDIEQEMNMVDLNVKALHILTKIFVKRFKEKNHGRIFNIGSLASFVPGPVFAAYYASKAYVFNLSVGINVELKKSKSKVRVVTICPGLLKTDFWNRSSNQENAKYKSHFKLMRTDKYVKKSFKKAFKTRKNYVIVSISHHLTKWFSIHMPMKLVLGINYRYQKNRK